MSGRRPMQLVSLASLALGLSLGCAHGGAGGPGGLASVDVRGPDGAPSSLARYAGRVLVLDVCAAWSNACLLNARAVHDACQRVCGDDVAVASLLLDEPGEPAQRSYREALGFSQDVLLPGPTTLQGRSMLGDLSGIPRLLVIDRKGRVVEDITGGVVSTAGIVRRVEGLR